jgi:hypothetical protein
MSTTGYAPDDLAAQAATRPGQVVPTDLKVTPTLRCKPLSEGNCLWPAIPTLRLIRVV